MAQLRALLPPLSVKTIFTCFLWYLVSSLTSQLTKVILVKFQYPLFLGQFQFLMGAILALIVITICKRFPGLSDYFPSGSVPIESDKAIFNKSILIKILPLGLFQFTGKFLSLSATSLIPLSTVSSIKALSPLLIVGGYRIIYGVKFPFVTYLSLTPLVGGVILIITSDSLKNPKSNDNLLYSDNKDIDYKQMKGIIFCIFSSIIFAVQNIYGKQLITWDSNVSSLNPTSLVLDTDPSRPGTPSLGNEGRFEPDDRFMHKKKHFIRQRANSVRLPYSTSDLKLDEKSEEVNLRNSSYSVMAEQNREVTSLWRSLFKTEAISKPDKMTIILYCSSIGFLISFLGFLFKELAPILRNVDDGDDHRVLETTSDIITIFVLILLNSISHFFQTLLALHLLSLIPALSYSIASMMKRIVLITVSIVFVMGSSSSQEGKFGSMTREQLQGLVLIAVGLYCYDKWGSKSLKSDRI
ncbi:uncharacterized protein PRCAT00000668001 [Priceomyces carsonii]|uniref:uncharacterized protein n=1 Tax=Priceomyces carsonii TaxID=28549 RepID=UPI002ED99951|nr:unnamed protein product [Priceomyces carsonii]